MKKENFNLMKKANFNLMKFDLIIISLLNQIKFKYKKLGSCSFPNFYGLWISYGYLINSYLFLIQGLLDEKKTEKNYEFFDICSELFPMDTKLFCLKFIFAI